MQQMQGNKNMSTKNREDDPLYDKEIQKILNKLISEETIANCFYIGCIAAACKCQKTAFSDMFVEIATDEMDDHCKHLCEWAVANDYSVPFKFKDYEKFADKAVVDQFNKLKENEDASYYVAEALKSEEDAIKSYDEALKYEDLPQALNAILLQNRYDEVEHYENLATLKNAIDNSVDLINW